MNNPYTAPTADLTLAESDVDTYQPRIFALTGRIGRVRYIAYSSLFSLLTVIPMIAIVVMMAMAGSKLNFWIYVLLVPLYATMVLMAARRLEDVGRSRWWAASIVVPWLNLIPYLYLLFKAGDYTANAYGPPPCANSRGVVVGAFAPVIFSVVMGIVAAVALPTYQSYTQRGITGAPASKL